MFFNNLIRRNTIEKFINERFIENKDKKINLKDIDTLYVAFNDFTITLPLIIQSYDAKLNKHSSDWIEILPSIYCLKTKEYFYIFNRYTGKNCYDRFLEKLLNGTFTFETNNKIEIARYRECFYLEEGKHRICTFKRYKRSDKIIADITYLKCNYHSYPDENMKYDKRYNSLPEEILEDYYEAYKKIGIEKKEATCITENIKNENFIEYFEGKYGNDIFQIMNDLKK